MSVRGMCVCCGRIGIGSGILYLNDSTWAPFPVSWVPHNNCKVTLLCHDFRMLRNSRFRLVTIHPCGFVPSPWRCCLVAVSCNPSSAWKYFLWHLQWLSFKGIQTSLCWWWSLKCLRLEPHVFIILEALETICLTHGSGLLLTCAHKTWFCFSEAILLLLLQYFNRNVIWKYLSF